MQPPTVAAVFVLCLVTLANGHLGKRTLPDDMSMKDLAIYAGKQADQILNQKSQLDAAVATLAKHSSRLAALEKSDNSQTVQLSRSVAFTARFSHDPVTHLGAHDILKFDSVQLNVGKAYESSTGVFTAPYSGTYVIFVSIMGYGATTEISLMLDGKIVDIAHANSDLHDQGSILATIYLKAGRKLWVQHNWASAVMKGGVWTDFSGFLLKAD